MPATEIQIKARTDTPIHRLTEKYPSLKIWMWCNFVQDVYEIVSESPEEFHGAVEEFRRIYHVLDETEISTNIRLITQNCVCSKETTVHDNIQELEILNLMPIYYTRGHEYYRLIAFRHEALSELFDRLTDQGFQVDVLEKAPFNGMVSDSLITLNSLVGSLTDKQVDAIVAAYNSGYYQTPRRVNVQTIADRARVPRTTLQEHLNKAENKLISSIIPQIQLYARKTRSR
jgi:predicted DNA binding protein